MNCTEYNPIKYLFSLNFSDPKILQWVNFFSTQLYSKTPMETLEPRLSRYLVWWLCINLQFSIEDFYIQVQLSDCEECLTVCIYSLNGNILLEISTFYVNAPTFTRIYLCISFCQFSRVVNKLYSLDKVQTLVPCLHPDFCVVLQL